MKRQLNTAFFFAAIISMVLAVGAPLPADTYVVNSTLDDVDAAPGDGACATAGGTCTLRAAVMEANAHPGADQVVVPAGVFRLTLLGPGEDAGLTGDLDITGGDSLTITGAGRDDTVIDGLAADRVLHALAGPSLTVRDLTIRNGSGVATPGGAILYMGPGDLTVARVRFGGNQATVGGAIAVQTANTLTVTSCIFEDDEATGSAGAIAVSIANGAMQISGTQFLWNRAADAGGAVRIAGPGATTITGSSFQNCQSQDQGGALAIATTGGLTITDCEFTFNISSGHGGAVNYMSPGAGDCTITGCQFVTNACSSTGNGGGCAVQTTGSLTVSDSRFHSNYANDVGGGLVAQAGPNISIHDSVFDGNVAMNDVGGGLALATLTGALAITNVQVSNNEAHNGGGGLVVSSQVSAAITACTFSGNRAGGLPGGGGAMVGGPGSPVITNCTFVQNTVENDRIGGGLVIHATAAGLTMTGCAFIENQAVGSAPGGSCGGLYYQAAGAGTITNCTFSGNLATNGAGGIGQGGLGDLTLTNCTLTDNGATGIMGGGAILRGGGFGNVYLQNTIIADSFAGDNCAGGTTSQGGNLDTGASCIFPLIPGADLTNTDPLLGPLADNGGPTLTHALLAGSPAIDAANPANCPSTDQRGQARPLDGDGDGTEVCDIGAFEFGDCNNDNQDDMAEIANGVVTDCNHNGIPDNCDSPDTDGDGIWDVCDACTDTDHDGFGDPGFPANTCPVDLCPADPNKQAPGLCGCGVADTDTDGDGTPDCLDLCPNDPNKQAPGLCGCGAADGDTDGDLVLDCLDNCPDTANPDQADSNSDGVGDACTLPPAGQPAPCGCSPGLPFAAPLTLLGVGWMKRRKGKWNHQ